MIIPHQLQHNPDHNCKFNARIQKKKEIEKEETDVAGQTIASAAAFCFLVGY
jgi:hypothetical protein